MSLWMLPLVLAPFVMLARAYRQDARRRRRDAIMARFVALMKLSAARNPRLTEAFVKLGLSLAQAADQINRMTRALDRARDIS